MDLAKKAAGVKAASYIQDGMIVGLGTGSTAYYFIQSLIEKKRKIQVVASSKASAELARKGGLHLLELNAAPPIDITVDGADEVDPKRRIIKGGGGAHVREKILAYASKKWIVIVDESKLVPQLGKAPLPVEIVPYGSIATRRHIEKLGLHGEWREQSDGELFITENGNLLFDIRLPSSSPEELDAQLRRIPGAIDTGFFFHKIDHLIVGKSDGTTLEK